MRFAVQNGRAMEWAYVDEDGNICARLTTSIQPGLHVREDDGPDLNAQYPQVCYDGSRLGPTLIWDDDEGRCAAEFARDVDATLCGSPQAYAKRLTKAGGRLHTAPDWSAARREN